MYLDLDLDRRQSPPPPPSPTNRLLRRSDLSGRAIFWIVALAFFVVAIGILLLFCFRRRCGRRSRRRSEKGSPKSILITRWTSADAGSNYPEDDDATRGRPSSDDRGRRSNPGTVRFEAEGGADTSGPSSSPINRESAGPSSGPGSAAAARLGRQSTAGANPSTPTVDGAVDRRASVRSVMTLPPYRLDPSTTEQVLGREGERDGIDVVVERPTVELEEELREEEMEALYQIRLYRRGQIAEREERRRLRREARARNDVVALDEIRARARADNSTVVLEGLRAEHDRLKDRRKRSVSSVAYADVGVASLDGTRVRANSVESERIGLLSDAASMAAGAAGAAAPAAAGASAAGQPRHHRRERSTSSVFSVDSDVTWRSHADSSMPRLGHTISSSSAGSGLVDPPGSGGSSRPVVTETDLADSVPPMSPPGYEEISLEDARSSGRTTPYGEPPPDYAGPSHRSTDSLIPSPPTSVRSINSGEEEGEGEGGPEQGRGGQGRGLVSRGRPSLRLSVGGGVPQIVVEPSSAEVVGGRRQMW